MSRTTFHVRAEMADGSSFDVVGDQRDIAEFECETFGVPFFLYETRPFTFIRYLAWHAGRREKLHPYATWEQFAAACPYAENVDKGKDQEATPEAQDPGVPAASAGD